MSSNFAFRLFISFIFAVLFAALFIGYIWLFISYTVVTTCVTIFCILWFFIYHTTFDKF